MEIEPTPVRALNGPDEELSSTVLGDGRRTAIDALYLAPRSVLAVPLAEELGVAIDAGLIGPFVRTDTAVMTTLPSVYAAGNIATPPQSASWAVADGITAGIAAHRALVFGEIRGTAMRGSSIYGMRDAEGMSRC